MLFFTHNKYCLEFLACSGCAECAREVATQQNTPQNTCNVSSPYVDFYTAITKDTIAKGNAREYDTFLRLSGHLSDIMRSSRASFAGRNRHFCWRNIAILFNLAMDTAAVITSNAIVKGNPRKHINSNLLDCQNMCPSLLHHEGLARVFCKPSSLPAQHCITPLTSYRHSSHHEECHREGKPKKT